VFEDPCALPFELEMSVAAVREFLNHGYHLKLKQNVESSLSILHGNPLRIQPHFTSSVLSSATLTTSYIKNFLVRNQESLNGGTIRRILNLTDYKHAAWKFKLDQSARKTQYTEVLNDLQLEEKKLVMLLKFKKDDSELSGQLSRLRENMKNVQMTLKLMKSTVTGSLHPESRSGFDGTASALGPTAPPSADEQDLEKLKIRGLLIRLSGPRKGNRALTWEKSVGAVSTNSVDFVVAEESKVQIPSKLGIFGLYVRIVYQKVSQRPSSGTRNPKDLTFFDGNSLFKPF
jgi:hypothetical protein